MTLAVFSTHALLATLAHTRTRAQGNEEAFVAKISKTHAAHASFARGKSSGGTLFTIR
jgi:hypothetical protein